MFSDSCVCGGTRQKPNAYCERCVLVYLFDRVVEMRSLQKSYFSTRDPKTCDAAKGAERMVDRTIARIREVQPTLFAEDRLL
jgi:hypothetical protein